ncbi:GNAT family N-acetyltransferase [Streptomyces pseudovenezuelae]|uniref:GNAT superfamily N-acetyltransferase n=1 Tax=Streptomyces pseudovenezuelae TaxID=67350 RepID=A0ABT6LKE6_9ACTN|nr:GNAT family N-acetyltransferase [Streptomyces pseudovenezuelae]MDH6216782.1 GNAT superfamily N-acetyltransferase [Streptomyces pseudovenezuelae]
MTVTVRDLRTDVPAEVAEYSDVRHQALPHILWTPAAILHNLTHTPPSARNRSLVAEQDGELIGTAQVGLAHDSPEPGQGYLNIYVRPDRAHRGAGTLLVRAAEEHLTAHGATKLYAWVIDAPANRAFAERHGYRASRSAHFLRLDLVNGALPPRQDLPAGAELRTGADFADDPRPVFRLDAETMADEPSDVEFAFTDYEAWLAETWRHPQFSPELTSVVLVDGRPAAFTLARTDGGTRYGTAMTGTSRDFRGRGLAKLAKNDSLHRARAAGYTEALTGNDAGNEPMLAVNKWFGYEVCGTEVRYVRELG